jgi:uncharacterized peroxidase-related enzyme
VAHVEPLPRSELAEFEPVFAMIEGLMGFVPNSLLTLGRSPEILRGFGALSGAVLGSSRIAPDLRQLVAFVASSAAGCSYCQAHTSHGAEKVGVPAEKLEAAFEFETSPLFDDAERAALRLARDAALQPNATTPAHFEALRRHFDEREIVDLVAIVSLFGWLNRWNDTMATPLEALPIEGGNRHLTEQGWSVGKHAR